MWISGFFWELLTLVDGIILDMAVIACHYDEDEED